MQKKKLKLLGPFICLLTAIIWGSGFPFQDIVGADASNIDGFSFNGLRFLIAGVTLIPVILIFEREKGLDGYHQQRIACHHAFRVRCRSNLFGR